MSESESREPEKNHLNFFLSIGSFWRCGSWGAF
jgi:hypothetical protein